MSNAVLPSYPGFKLEAEKSSMWSTLVSESVSFLERRVSQTVYPKWKIDLSVEVLRHSPPTLDELRSIVGFFNLRAGAFDSFRYTDPDDNAVTDEQFGVRDGVTLQFQLLRTWGGFAEPVQNVNVLTNIKSNGVTLTSPTDYTIDANGLVTLAAAGTNGHVLTWTGSYYWRVRFADDDLPHKKLFQGLFDLKKLPLIGSVMNKV